MIPLLLTLYGILASLYISYCDIKTTILPERLVKSMILVGIVGWAISGSLDNLIVSVQCGAIYFLFGYALYFAKHWASGDAWVLAGLGAIFAPMVPNFAVMFPLIAIFIGFLWSFIWYMYFLLSSDIWKIVRLEISLFFTLPLVANFTPSIYPIYLSLITLIILLKTYHKVDKLLVLEKKAVELEEDDWLIQDLKLGKQTINANRPVGKKEVKLAQEFGGKKIIKVKTGIPFVPVLALSMLVLVFGLV
ncbi:MAG: prepilin peptidase [Candidatus Altiarchaeota archaeon]|nr:prepilin peptidase [Candidatus Altiarchaeota archaeon]